MIITKNRKLTVILIVAGVLWGVANALAVVEAIWALNSTDPLIPEVYEVAEKVLPTIARPLALGIWALLAVLTILSGYLLWRRLTVAPEPLVPAPATPTPKRTFQVATPHGSQESTDVLETVRELHATESVRITGSLPKHWNSGGYVWVDVTFEVPEPMKLSRLGLWKEKVDISAEELPVDVLEGLSVHRVRFKEPSIQVELNEPGDMKMLRLWATIGGIDLESESFGMYFSLNLPSR